ncbi:hypothetical protein HYX09_02500 [Candidatus Woesearchaeota archaeon]|nr:hypothetical protein [Candidatus Woesearchaeota archaeon]
MTSMKSCLQQVKRDGRVDAGFCKELFSQHLCGLVWQLVRAASTKKCSPYDSYFPDMQKGTPEPDKLGFRDYISLGTSSIDDALKSSQESFTEEYGNSQLNQVFGTGHGSIARRLCLGAFGYDWDFNIGGVVDLAYASPSATNVIPILPRREFISPDPLTGSTSYVYRAGYIINPGCDFDSFNIYLSCVGRNQQSQYPNQVDCGKQNDKYGSNCDCQNQDNERTYLLQSGRALRQTVGVDSSAHGVVKSPYRFDHLKFVLTPSSRISQDLREKCFPDGYRDGIFYFPISDHTTATLPECRLGSNGVECDAGLAFEEFGFGKIESVGIFIGDNPIDARLVQNAAGSPEVYVGQKVEVEPLISSQPDKPKCIRINVEPSPYSEDVYFMSGSSYQQKLDITKHMSLDGLENPIQFPEEVSAELMEQSNRQVVTIDIDYKEVGGDGIDFAKDADELRIRDNIQSFTTFGELRRQGKLTPGGLVVQQNDAKVRIARLVQKSEAGALKEISSVRIVVNPSSITASQQRTQLKAIKIGLYNPKPGVAEITGANDCDFNNIARDVITGASFGSGIPQERTIYMTLRKSELPGVQGPRIQLQPPAPKTASPGQEVTVTATVTDPFQQADRSLGNPAVVLELQGEETPPSVLTPGNNGDLYTFRINTNDLRMAGVYRVKVTATSRSTNPPPRPESASNDFTLKCSNDGMCESSCAADRVINKDTAPFCPSGKQCCRT